MVKAFHAVAGGPQTVRSLLERGELRPAWERIDPAVAAQLCQKLTDAITYEGTHAGPAAARAALDLLDERLKAIVSTPPYSESTAFDCEDLLAGDVHHIFLSIDGWHGALSEEDVQQVSGFVFDAKALVKAGGVLRSHDLIDEYWQVVTGFLYEPGGRKTVESLKRSLSSVRKKADLSGAAAIAALRKSAYYRPAELLFPGRLPLDWAVEIWEDGKRV